MKRQNQYITIAALVAVILVIVICLLMKEKKSPIVVVVIKDNDSQLTKIIIENENLKANNENLIQALEEIQYEKEFLVEQKNREALGYKLGQES